MLTNRIHRRVLAVVVAAAALPLGAPVVANAAAPHPPPGPARLAHHGGPVAVTKETVRLTARGDTDVPPVAAV